MISITVCNFNVDKSITIKFLIFFSKAQMFIFFYETLSHYELNYYNIILYHREKDVRS